jgi:hypothetical protein
MNSTQQLHARLGRVQNVRSSPLLPLGLLLYARRGFQQWQHSEEKRCKVATVRPLLL